MNVAALRALLAALPSEALVVMAKDGEGNSFSPFDEAGDGMYVAESSYSGHLRDEEYDPEDGPDGAVPCIVLWPAN